MIVKRVSFVPNPHPCSVPYSPAPLYTSSRLFFKHVLYRINDDYNNNENRNLYFSWLLNRKRSNSNILSVNAAFALYRDLTNCLAGTLSLTICLVCVLSNFKHVFTHLVESVWRCSAINYSFLPFAGCIQHYANKQSNKQTKKSHNCVCINSIVSPPSPSNDCPWLSTLFQ